MPGKPKTSRLGNDRGTAVYEVIWADESSSAIRMQVRLNRPTPPVIGGLPAHDSEGEQLALEEAARVAERFISSIQAK